MTMQDHPLKQGYAIAIFVASLWLVRIIDAIIPIDLNQWGLQPRRLDGLPGILLMPFLHAGFGHLISNTVPLVVLLGLTVGSRRKAWPAIVAITVVGGVLLWLFGRNANHVGASGLVFGLIAYLITVGIREKQLASIAIAVIVGLLFGTTLLTGILPKFGSAVSWDGHLAGAIGGCVVAMITTTIARPAHAKWFF